MSIHTGPRRTAEIEALRRDMKDRDMKDRG